MPDVSVVMTVFNGQRYLASAVDSILGQTLADFELIIVDDGSYDSTPRILEGYASDSRVRVVSQPNAGIAAAANVGLALARGELIARMDADDLSEPHRLEAQQIFMRQNPAVGVLGSACRLIDDDGRPVGAWRAVTGSLAIRWASLLTSPFVHSSVVFRRRLVQEHRLSYPVGKRAGLDYEFLTNLLSVTDGANLAETLVSYRVHPGSVSSRLAQVQLDNHNLISRQVIGRELPNLPLTLEQVANMHALLKKLPVPPDVRRQRAKLAGLYLAMWDAFDHRRGRQAQPGERSALKRQVAQRAAGWLLRSPGLPGSGEAFRRLWSLDAAWPVILAGAMPRALLGRLRHKTVRQLRHEQSLKDA